MSVLSEMSESGCATAMASGGEGVGVGVEYVTALGTLGATAAAAAAWGLMLIRGESGTANLGFRVSRWNVGGA